MSHNYQVLLFYCYSKIKDTVKFRRDHLRFCIENNIVGRIIISDEGINGTISGKEIDCKSYINEIKRQKTFNDIDFKIDSVDSNVFNKINVRIKDEIVNSGIKNKKIIEKRGNYIEPSEFKSAFGSYICAATNLNLSGKGSFEGQPIRFLKES